MALKRESTFSRVMSAVVSGALVGALVPLAPSVARAEEDVAAAAAPWALAAVDESTGLAKTLIYDNHVGESNEAVPQEISAEMMRSILAARQSGDKSAFVAPELDAAPEAVSEAARRALDTRLEEDAKAKATDDGEVAAAAAAAVADAVDADELHDAVADWIETANTGLTSSAPSDYKELVEAKVIEQAGIEGTYSDLTLSAVGDPTINVGAATLAATKVTISGVTADDGLLAVPVSRLAFNTDSATADDSPYTGIKDVAAMNEAVAVSDVAASGGGATYGLTACAPSDATGVNVTYTYDRAVTAYGYTYGAQGGASYDIAYTYDGYRYAGWSFTQDFAYSYVPAGATGTVAPADAEAGKPASPTVAEVIADTSEGTEAPNGKIVVREQTPAGYELQYRGGSVTTWTRLTADTELKAATYELRYHHTGATQSGDAATTHADSDLTTGVVVSEPQTGVALNVGIAATDKVDLAVTGDATPQGGENLTLTSSCALDVTDVALETAITVDEGVEGTQAFGGLVVVNLYDDTALAALASEPVTFALTFGDEEPEAVYAYGEVAFAGGGVDAATAQALSELAFAGATATDDAWEDEFAIAYDDADGSVTLKPKHATVEVADNLASVVPRTVSLTWKAGDLTVTRDVQVTIEPLAVDLNDYPDNQVSQPFRLHDDEVDPVLTQANEQVRAIVALATADKATWSQDAASAMDGDYFTAVELPEGEGAYDWQGTSDVSLEPTWTTDVAADSYADYLITPFTSVTVQAMEDVAWGDDNVRLAATGAAGKLTITAGNASTWINTAPTASWGGHTLSYAETTVPLTADGFAASVELSRGDGRHFVTMYARDDASKVVTNVAGITYQLDTKAPVVMSAGASSGTVRDRILFRRDVITVTLGLQDTANANDAESRETGDSYQGSTSEFAASGIDSARTSVTYADDESGTTDIPATDLVGSAVGAGDLSYTYTFNIDGDKDVPTSSINVSAYDHAGNHMQTTADKATVPMSVYRLVADSTGPTMSVSWADNGVHVHDKNYYDANRTLTVTINDTFFNYTAQYANNEIFRINRNGEDIVIVTPSDFTGTGDTRSYSYTFSDDADYVVSSMAVRDIVGHVAYADGDTFTIDKTDPTMDVTFDNNNAVNGNYYNAARTATITVTEHNFLESLVTVTPTSAAGNGSVVGNASVGGWSGTGDVHTASVTFPGEGVYTLAVSGTDAADRAMPSHTTSEFVVDTTKPEISITGVENLAAIMGEARPHVSVSDTNVSDATTVQLDKVSYPVLDDDDDNPYVERRTTTATQLTVSYPDPERVAANDGVYTLAVEARDMAGNTATQAVTWSVNRFGSTYVLSSATTKMLNSYLTPERLGPVTVTEINPSGLDENETAVELTHDTSNTTLRAGRDYTVREDDSSGWHEYTYELAKSNFDADGSYRVMLHSKDMASNMSENTMSNKDATREKTAEIAFAVDGKSPIVSFIDLDPGAYNETGHDAQVSVEDNLKLDHAVVRVDGREVLELDSDELAASAVHGFRVDESPVAHEVSVTAYDAAGNSETVSVGDVLVTTDPVRLWMANTPLFVGSIVGVAAVAVAGVALAVGAARRRRRAA